MIKYYLKVLLCITVMLLLLVLLGLSIMEDQGFFGYMFLAMGVVSFLIGLRIFLLNEKVLKKRIDAIVFNQLIADKLYLWYIGSLGIISAFYSILILQGVIDFTFGFAFFLFPSFLNMSNFECIVVDKEALYVHGKWYAYEDMKEYHIEEYEKAIYFYFYTEKNKELRIGIKEKEKDFFIETIQNYIDVPVEMITI